MSMSEREFQSDTGAEKCRAFSVVLCLLICSSAIWAQPTVPFSPPMPDDLLWPEKTRPDDEGLPEPERMPVIVVDPGHGYRDYGVVGIGGVQEKTIVLDIAVRIRKMALKDGIVDVKLTRKGDESHKLVDRANMANRAAGTEPADALVSIHLATSLDTNVTGYQVYYAGGGAGEFELDGVFEIGVQQQTIPVRRWNRQYKRHVARSEVLARRIDRQMDRALLRRRDDVRHAPLRLLRIVDMPACLIEVGVISNGGEEARLKSDRTLDKCATAIYEGVLDFLGKRFSVDDSDAAVRTDMVDKGEE